MSAMNGRPRIGVRLDEIGLDAREPTEPFVHARGVARRRAVGKLDEHRVVASLGGEELGVEGPELAPFGHGLEEELEALARARLNQRADEQAIEERARRIAGERTRRTTEALGVGVDGRRAERQPADLEEGDHPLEVIDLLLGEVRDARTRTRS